MREGYEVYEAYLIGHEKEIEEGKELILEVKNFEDFQRVIVKAIIAKSADALPGSEPLWIRDYKEDTIKQTEPWAIKVIEELDEDEFEAKRFDHEEARKTGQRKR
ncbi:MAG: hypothetical protein AUJ48_03270 [Deltaproteobacteria bacterium CG1_02_45_11]|nr:MAG: hypothetical protein AUJ48_03270 [Deltaproteobacteria bacterium CG1_02_45_11]